VCFERGNCSAVDEREPGSLSLAGTFPGAADERATSAGEEGEEEEEEADEGKSEGGARTKGLL